MIEVAFCSMSLANGAASVAIGTILGVTAWVLAVESKALLIGEAADPELVRGLRSRGTTVVVITHRMHEVWALAARFRAKGGRTAFLSNSGPEVMARVRADHPLEACFDAVVISCASCSGELPVGTKPVVGLPLPDVTTTTTTTAAMATTTATTAAMMMFRFLFLPPPPPCRACRYGPGPMTGMGEVEGSDAYHGPDDLLPPESLVTHGTVPTRQLRHKRSCYIMPGTWSLNPGR